MSEDSKSLSQKEYLKRYLSKDKKDKKKKKKVKISSSSHIKRSVIIDDNDDVRLSQVANVNDEEFNLDFLGDEAPQVVGIVDDRPQELIQFESGAWKPISEEGEENSVGKLAVQQTSSEFIADVLKDAGSLDILSNVEVIKKRNNTDKSDSDISVERYGKSSKQSTKKNVDVKPKKQSTRKNDSDSDVSVDRSRTKLNGNAHKSKVISKQRTRNDHGTNSDDSLYEDNKKENSNKFKIVNFNFNFKSDSNSDLSSRRHRKSDNERSYRPEIKTNRKSDESPRRSRNRRDKNEKSYREDACQTDSDSDLSPPRNYKKSSDYQGSANYARPLQRQPKQDLYKPSSAKKNRSPTYRKMLQSDRESETLDGKKAGLQNAKFLKEELERLKEKEDRAFQSLDPRLLGQSAAPIMRDKKTGQKRDLDRERKEESAKTEKNAILKNKYDRWGRGLKQVQERADMLADTAYEMSKPLARYKDDEDLDKYLRAQEREGDPMLQYIRQQQLESHKIDLTVEGESSLKRVYHGSYMPNRFSIPPGHRWDGVDRSNGYEKKWFEHKNAKKAIEEAAYKWSTSDM